MTSVLTEPSALPTANLGKFHGASSTSVDVVERPAQLQPEQGQQRGGEGEAAEVAGSIQNEFRRSPTRLNPLVEQEI